MILAVSPLASAALTLSGTAKEYLRIMFFVMSYFVVGQAINTTLVVGVFRSGGDTLTGMFLDLGSLWLVSIPLTLIAARVLHLPFLGVVMTAYLGEDIPKSIFCMRHFLSMRWLRPVTEEGREGLRLYREEQK